jgi:aminoglycoside 6-adenylyltransferase
VIESSPTLVPATSIAELEARFVRWAEAEDDLRAALVVGSRARVDHPADPLADLDILLFANHVDRYLDSTAWIEELSPIWVSVVGRTSPTLPQQLVVFCGGLQVDFLFNTPAVLQQARQMVERDTLPDILRRGVRVLVDKDQLLPLLPAPSKPPPRKPPTESEFHQTLESFWFSAVYCAKQLQRGELWTFQDNSGGMLSPLLRVVEWRARTTRGWDYDTWHDGKFIAEWAGPEVYDGLRETFAHLDAADGWRAVRARLALFHRLAREVSARLGYTYPDELEAHIAGYVDTLRHRESDRASAQEHVSWLERQTLEMENWAASGYVLDLGGGGEGIIGQLKPQQVIAIDTSRRELAEAAAGPLKIVMDARELHFLDATFQTVTACFTLMFIGGNDHQQVFREAFRVLRAGGRFLIWDAHIPRRPDNVPPEQRIVAFELVVQMPGRQIETGYGTRWPSREQDAAYYIQIAEAAGFHLVAQRQQGRVFFLELEKPDPARP